LKNREEFRKMIFDYFEDPFTLLDENQLETEFTRYLLVFRDKAQLDMTTAFDKSFLLN
jgi:hypothetical protein